MAKSLDLGLQGICHLLRLAHSCASYEVYDHRVMRTTWLLIKWFTNDSKWNILWLRRRRRKLS